MIAATYFPPNPQPVLNNQEVNHALRIARHTFPYACGGWYRPIPHVVSADDIGARARGDKRSCTIWLDREWLATSPAARELCDVVLHEYGHLAGLEHNDNPRSIMYGKFLFDDPRCHG